MSAKTTAPEKPDIEQISPEDIHVHDTTQSQTTAPVTSTPWQLLRMLNRRQFLVFLASWMAWMCDAFDFHSVSVTIPEIAHTFHKTPSQITWAITLALLFRAVGAVIFGLAGDRYGRKWPMVVCCLLFGLLDCATGFTNTYSQFLIVRALYGIALGGIWGCAMGVALENMPHECRGIYSGILQQGYAFGYLFAAVMNYALTDATSHGWRLLFWFGIGPACLVALFRALLPDEDTVRRNAADRMPTKEKTRLFILELKGVLKQYPWRIIHAVLLMAAFNFMSHGSQDLYPTFLELQRNQHRGRRTLVTIIFNCGAILGGFLCGHFSQKFGRRNVIMIACVGAGACIPLWTLPQDWRILALGAFLLQFCVQGAWGVVPIHLNEISPSPTLRAAFSGIAYQFGNAISSPSSQIISRLAESHRTDKIVNGEGVPDYSKVQAIFLGIVLVNLILLTAVSPEMRGRRFEEEISETSQKEIVEISPKEETV